MSHKACVRWLWISYVSTLLAVCAYFEIPRLGPHCTCHVSHYTGADWTSREDCNFHGVMTPQDAY